jgi:hypothetical protein
MTTELLQTEIKGRKITYYLISASDFEEIRGRSIFSDICLFLLSVCIGGLLTIFLTEKSVSEPLPKESVIILNTAKLFLWIGAFVFAAFYAWLIYKLFSQINFIKESGTLDEFSQTATRGALGVLSIINATYFTEINAVDYTEKIKALIKENKLSLVISNDMTGEYFDPEPGRLKRFNIRYTYGDKFYEKTFNEGDFMNLP